jgi:hypothetical protein
MLRTVQSALAAVLLAALVVVVPQPDDDLPASPAAARPTPPAATTSGGVVVVAAGDIACPPGSPPTPAGCQQRATARAVLAQHPAAVLLLGDNQYRDGALWRYRASYDPTWGRFIRRTYPTPGNHEYETPRAAGYYRYFGSRAAALVRPWYSFRLGSWHLVALNGNCGAVDCAAEAAWLPFGAVAATSQVRKTGTFGVLRLTLERGGYRWRFVHAAGAPFGDSGSGRCH